MGPPASAEARPRAARARDAVLLGLLFVVLHARALDWGLPSLTGWIPDELLPGDVVRGIEMGFGGGWHERYPPLHYYLLALLDGLVLRAQGVPARNPLPADAYAPLFLLGRVVSLAMGAGSAVLLYLCGARLRGRVAGVLAALLAMGMPTLGFHTRLATLDVPYLFWWLLSLLFALRALDGGRRRDLLIFGLAAGLAVTTKDQAYGLYVLAGPALFVLLRARGLQDARGARRALGFGDVVLPLALGAVVFALVHRLPGNTAGFVAHVELMTGPASQPYRMFPPTFVGQGRLVLEIARQVGTLLGWPAFVLAFAALLRDLRRRALEPGELYVLASAVSYCLAFLCVLLYSYDRFVLPLACLCALFAGGGLARLLERRGAARGLALVAALLLAAFSLGRGVQFGRLLACDSRYAAERWLREHAAAGDRTGFLAGWKDMPRPDGLRARILTPDEGFLARMQPRFVVVNLNRAAQVGTGDLEAPFLEGLRSGRLGYALVWRWREPVPWPLSAELDALADCSNLYWVNPWLAVYERRAPPAGRSSGRAARLGLRGRLDAALGERQRLFRPDVHDQAAPQKLAQLGEPLGSGVGVDFVLRANVPRDRVGGVLAEGRGQDRRDLLRQ